jgi:hypothetical protein
MGIAFVIGIPLAIAIINKWLQYFAYHISLTPAIFIVITFGMLFLAMLIVNIQTIKVAMRNPSESLRYE